MSFEAQPLPPRNLNESNAVLKKLTTAHRYLAELKGVAASIPNQAILINTLALQEAKDSSTVENIIKKIERARLKMEQIKPGPTLPPGKKTAP